MTQLSFFVFFQIFGFSLVLYLAEIKWVFISLLLANRYFLHFLLYLPFLLLLGFSLWGKTVFIIQLDWCCSGLNAVGFVLIKLRVWLNHGKNDQWTQDSLGRSLHLSLKGGHKFLFCVNYTLISLFSCSMPSCYVSWPNDILSHLIIPVILLHVTVLTHSWKRVLWYRFFFPLSTFTIGMVPF